MKRIIFHIALVSAVAAGALGATQEPSGKSLWADFVEPHFPFFSSVVDARQAGGFAASDNVTPRGLVLNLGRGQWACFDTELLRVSAAWTGGAVTPRSMAQASYAHWSQKSKIGESALPQPDGKVWLANGVYPGWQSGNLPRFEDPRTPGPSPQEVGRGPLAEREGRFRSIRLLKSGIWLNYEIEGVAISEQITGETGGIARRLRIQPAAHPMTLVLGTKPLAADWSGTRPAGAELTDISGHLVARIAAHSHPLDFVIALGRETPPVPSTEASHLPRGPLWPQTVETAASLAKGSSAYVVDDIALPLQNPWRRNVRPADIQFLPDGRAALVTIDGDVWLASGLGGDMQHVRWKRFASGFNEPLSLTVRDGEVYVFDRNGIWKIKDTTGEGEADEYDLFSNVFAQSADSREYPSCLRAAPDGSFVIAKGGEQSEILGKLNGTVLRISSDGRSFRVLGWGFRQPFIGVNPTTGEVTASDQEGNYVPATPLYDVEDGGYHGYLAPFQAPEHYPAPIAEPLTWIPHNIAPSAITQVWATDPRFGPLCGSMILVSYNYPELFRVLIDRRGHLPQAAVVSLTHDFSFPPLSGAICPTDGQLYVAGFKIFGTASERVSGLARVRFTGQPSTLPDEVAPTDRGVVLAFGVALDPTSVAPGAFRIARWNYRRSSAYGSFDYRLDGTVGQDSMPVTSVALSSDHRHVLVSLSDMRIGVMQMSAAWRLRSVDGQDIAGSAYFTPRELRRPPEGEFKTAVIATAPGPSQGTPGEDLGRQLYQALGCMACHSVDGAPRIGPTWKGLYGSQVPLANGTTTLADDAYFKRHLSRHPNEMVRGFAPAMPDYSALATDSQIDALIGYLRTLR